MNFDHAVEIILRYEGGYVNDPYDPGGETNFGISKRSNPGVDIKNLTRESAKEIYRIAYWNPLRAEVMPAYLQLAHFDTAVNCGLHASEEILKKSNGSLEAYLLHRIFRYVSIANKNSHLKKFLNGWLNRVADVYRETIKKEEV